MKAIKPMQPMKTTDSQNENESIGRLVDVDRENGVFNNEVASHKGVWSRFMTRWNTQQNGSQGQPGVMDSPLQLPLSDEQLQKVYKQLYKCCDSKEGELKDAIGYGHRLLDRQRNNNVPGNE